MPYFKNNEFNILFIHIPKTGGTSIECFFFQKMNFTDYTKLPNLKILFEIFDNNIENYNDVILFKKKHFIESSLQHITYQQIIHIKEELYIDFKNNLKIITVVRNPYYKLISDLFFFRLIEINSSKEIVFTIISNYLLEDKKIYDNHNLPQYQFLIDENGNIPDEINIFKTETLIHDLAKFGYDNFNIHLNCNEKKTIDYIEYLNQNSINLINEFYSKDFELFNYQKL